MKTLDEIYQIVEQSSHETAFNKGEVAALYKYLHLIPVGNVLEIGIEYGRSTSVIAEIQKERGYKFYAVDPFNVQDNGAEAKAHVLSQIKKYKWNINLLEMTSEKAKAKLIGKKFNLIHIDGDHSYEAVRLDCDLWLSNIEKGGFVCFDDYGHNSLPGVFQAVTEYMSEHGGFKYIGRFGEKLGVFKKYEF